MTAIRSVPGDDRFIVTEAGIEALAFAPACKCKPKLVGYLVECSDCGTVYGHVKELNAGGTDRWDKKR